MLVSNPLEYCDNVLLRSACVTRAAALLGAASDGVAACCFSKTKSHQDSLAILRSIRIRCRLFRPSADAATFAVVHGLHIAVPCGRACTAIGSLKKHSLHNPLGNVQSLA